MMDGLVAPVAKWIRRQAMPNDIMDIIRESIYAWYWLCLKKVTTPMPNADQCHGCWLLVEVGCVGAAQR